MAHVLAAIRHAKTSFYIHWPGIAVSFGVVASFAWTAFLGYLAIALVKLLINTEGQGRRPRRWRGSVFLAGIIEGRPRNPLSWRRLSAGKSTPAEAMATPKPP
jgi:hypothetical protein